MEGGAARFWSSASFACPNGCGILASVAALTSYPYLTLSLVLAALAAAGALLFPNARRSMLVCGLGAAPTSLLTVSFVPAYWQPVRIGGAWIGMEDVLFSFATGALMWLTFSVFLRRDLDAAPSCLGGFLRRYFTCGPAFLAVYYLLRQADCAPMASALGGMLILGLGMSLFAADLLLPAIAGGALFGTLYSVTLAASFAVWPEFSKYWSVAYTDGFVIGTIPAAEIAWAVGAGIVYPLVMSYVMSPSLLPRRSLLVARVVPDSE